jgi:hypothetical protein
MQKRLTACVLTMLSITCGTALAAQLTPAQKIDRVTTLLTSLETRALRPLAYLGSSYPKGSRGVGVRRLEGCSRATHSATADSICAR